MKPVDELVLAMAEIAANDHAWRNFLEKFQAYRQEQFVLMSQAPPDRLQVFQGRAQMLSDLLTYMQDVRARAKALRDVLEQKEKNHAG